MAPTGKQIRQDSAIPYMSQITNDKKAIATDLDLKTATAEVTAPLKGDASAVWHPLYAIVKVTAITGVADGASAITIGTASAGTELVGATVTGLDADGESVIINFTGVKAEIAGNATLFVRCTTADTGAGAALVASIHIFGEFL